MARASAALPACWLLQQQLLRGISNLLNAEKEGEVNPTLHRQAGGTEPWQSCNTEVLFLGAVFQRNGKG